MTNFYILYNIESGNIARLQTWPIQEQIATGYATAEISQPTSIDTHTHRYDADTSTVVERVDKKQIEINQYLSQIRSQRNARLAMSDWTQLSDVHFTAEQKQSWSEYRQQLRDIMNGIPDIIDKNYRPSWPIKPNE